MRERKYSPHDVSHASPGGGNALGFVFPRQTAIHSCLCVAPNLTERCRGTVVCSFTGRFVTPPWLGIMCVPPVPPSIMVSKLEEDINARRSPDTTPFDAGEIKAALKYLEEVESKVMLDGGMIYRI